MTTPTVVAANSATRHLAPVLARQVFRRWCVVGAIASQLFAGCTIVVERGANARDYYIFGAARLRLPTVANGEGEVHAQALEISGVGVAVSDYFQLGYFKQFQVSLKP